MLAAQQGSLVLVQCILAAHCHNADVIYMDDESHYKGKTALEMLPDSSDNAAITQQIIACLIQHQQPLPPDTLPVKLLNAIQQSNTTIMDSCLTHSSQDLLSLTLILAQQQTDYQAIAWLLEQRVSLHASTRTWLNREQHAEALVDEVLKQNYLQALTVLAKQPAVMKTLWQQQAQRARLLHLLPSMSTLNLSHCQLTEADVKLLADSIRDNRSLTTLDLSHNQLGRKEAERIHQALQSNTTLTILSLEDNNIGWTGYFTKNNIQEKIHANQVLFEQLMQAVRRKDSTCVAQLMKQSVSINQTDADGYSPMGIAIEQQDEAMLKQLHPHWHYQAAVYAQVDATTPQGKRMATRLKPQPLPHQPLHATASEEKKTGLG